MHDGFKKNGVNHYGYKNNICIDVEHGFIRRYAVTAANIHDSQILPMLLDPENTDRITASTKQEKIDVLDKYFRDGKISAEEEKI